MSSRREGLWIGLATLAGLYLAFIQYLPPVRSYHLVGDIDVRALRRRLRMTQAAFAARFAVELRTVQNREQGQRRPEGPARVLLQVIDREPEAVMRALEPVA